MTLAPERPKTQPAVNSRVSVDGTATRPQRPAFKASGRPNPAAHLTPAQIEELGRELDAIRAEVIESRGERDAAYIRRVIAVQRWLEVGGRVTLLASGVKVKGIRPAWWIGTAALSVAKILENMELGHNVLHGQWDWMRDPKIHSTTWDWDFVSPAYQWKKTHNELHHTYTNVLGKDNDLGYGILRVDPDQEWTPYNLTQPVVHWVNAAFFEYGIAAYDLDLRGMLVKWKDLDEARKQEWKKDANAVLGKIRRQVAKDYVAWPALGLATGAAGPMLAAGAVANVTRNLWANTVIVCGHFPEGVQTFETDSIEGETRGEWYLRQMLGSANISGSRLMHTMTGNLSHQIEHHLFPDLPSNRYIEIAPKVRALMERYDLKYVSGPLPVQFASVYRQVLRFSLPNKEVGVRRRDVVRKALAETWRGHRASRAARPAHGSQH